MKDQHDSTTQDLFIDPKKPTRGRPVTGHAMTSAQRQKAYRDRQKQHPAPDLLISSELQIAREAAVRYEALYHTALERIGYLEADLATRPKKRNVTKTNYSEKITNAKNAGFKCKKQQNGFFSIIDSTGKPVSYDHWNICTRPRTCWNNFQQHYGS